MRTKPDCQKEISSEKQHPRLIFTIMKAYGPFILISAGFELIKCFNAIAGPYVLRYVVFVVQLMIFFLSFVIFQLIYIWEKKRQMQSLIPSFLFSVLLSRYDITLSLFYIHRLLNQFPYWFPDNILHYHYFIFTDS